MSTQLVQTLAESSPRLCVQGEMTLGHTPPEPGFTRGTTINIQYDAEKCPVPINYYKITDGDTKEPLGYAWVDTDARPTQVLIVTSSEDDIAAQLIEQQLQSVHSNVAPLQFKHLVLPTERANYLLYLLIQNEIQSKAIQMAQNSAALTRWEKIAEEQTQQLAQEGIDISVPMPTIPEYKTVGRHTLVCPWLSELENTPLCADYNLQRDYQLLNNKSAEAIERLLRGAAGSCYYGRMSLAVDQAQKKAGIYDIELTPCTGGRKVVVLHLEFGDFDFDGMGDLKRQVDTYRAMEPNRIGHAMGLILDEDTKTGELFEPNSPSVWWVEPVRRSLIQWGKDRYETIDSPRLFCPNVNIQTKIGEGVCLAMAMLYLSLRVHCPTISRADILKGLTEAGTQYLNSLLQKFLCNTRRLLAGA